ncbi:hypothetical protein HC864_02610, partial [Candidatus Gracilibacteria bacterium]|nr:hypothetical protein [Candidatus Gracilibacteria bacterium]
MNTIKKEQVKSKRISFILIGLLLIGISVLLIFQNYNRPSNNPQSKQEIVEIIEEKNQEGEVIFDADGAKLTQKLKKSGLNIGFVGSVLYKSLDIDFPEKAQEDEVDSLKNLFPNYQPLSTLIEAPKNPTKRNQLIWEQYEITTPIQYAAFDDIFLKVDGTNTYSNFVDNNPIDSPIQLKLRDGVVHLPFSPAPGELGNSYIIGHSSNYNNVQSDYNYIFAPLINKVSKRGKISNLGLSWKRVRIGGDLRPKVVNERR